MRKAKNLIALLLCVAMVASIAACGGKDDPVPSGPSNSAGGTIVFGLAKTWETLRTTDFINGTTYQVGSQIFDRLTYLDENYEVHPRGAKSWEWADDGMSITFHLDENAKWHDGEKVTAEDYVFSYNFYATSEVQFQNRAGSKYLMGVDPNTGIETEPDAVGAEAVDEYTLKLNMNSLYNRTSYMVSATNAFFVLPKHCFVKADGTMMSDTEIYENSAYWNAPIGSGPCKYVSEMTDSSVTLEAVKDYHLGAPQFDTLIMQVIDTSTAIDKILSGDVDILGFNLPTEVAEQYVGDKNINIVKEQNPTTQVNLCFNSKRVPLRIRQAVDRGINKADILTKIYSGNGVVSDSFIFPNYPGYTDMKLYDTAAAKKLVEEAIAVGEWNADSKLIIGVVNTTGENTATLIKAQLAEIGINVEIKQDEMSTIQQAMITDLGEGETFQYSAGLWSVGAAYVPAKILGIMALYADNLFFHNDPSGALPLYMQYISAQTPEEEESVVKAFQQWEADNAPQSTLVQYGAYSATAPRIGNVDLFNASNFNHASWLWTVN